MAHHDKVLEGKRSEARCLYNSRMMGIRVVLPLSPTDAKNNTFSVLPPVHTYADMPQPLLPGPGAIVVRFQGDHAVLLAAWMACLSDCERRVLYFGITISL